jgi:hypothetical protein
MIGKFFLPDCKAKPDDYFLEASMQCTAEMFAQEYNKQQCTPKKIAFLSCYVVQLNQRPGTVVFIMEPMLKGVFKKHNNNYGEVYSDQETPEAFSHYTYQKTQGKMLVCDIQGVGEFFTDPQIHTPIGTDYGMGNMGAEGLARWKKTHVCNSLCRQLKLFPLAGPSHILPVPSHTLPVVPMGRPHAPFYDAHHAVMASYLRIRPQITSDPQEESQLKEALRRSMQVNVARPTSRGMTEEERLNMALQRSLLEK